MKKNRSEIQVIVDFLKCVQDGDEESQVSSILRKVNITYAKYKELAESLTSNGLVEVRANGDKQVLILTQKGANFIKDYEKFKKLIESNYGFKI